MAWMLDTHALIWALFEPDKLGRTTRAILNDPANEVLVSPLSYWEISLKSGLGQTHASRKRILRKSPPPHINSA